MLKDTLKNYKYFIFDVDGTLIDSINSVLTALKKAVKLSGIGLPDSCFTQSLIGPKIFDIARMLLPDGTPVVWEQIAMNFRAIYDEDPCDGANLFPNVRDFFSVLAEEQKHIYIATNKPYIPTSKLLTFFDINRFLGTDNRNRIFCPNSLPDKDLIKSEMVNCILEKIFHSDENAKDQMVMVGDTKSDLEAANVNGIDFAFFYSGYAGNKDEIISNISTKLVFKDYKELYD